VSDTLDRLKVVLADRYAIQRELGAGGMATVYLAEDLKHHRKVALKVLRPDLAATLGPERFIREITVAANLQHPHVLPLYDSGEAGGFLFYVMPYVDGPSLRQKLIREGPLPITDAVRILRDVADALAYAHQRGLVHRDIKPENVMQSGRHALVTDFGVAKAVSEATGYQRLTTAGVALGTPAYMAPEQAVGDPHTDHRADIYAFGALAYELLTGRPPFVEPTVQAVLAAHVTAEPEPVSLHRASVPPVLAALVMRCLEKKPADRYQTADELVPQLEMLLTPSGGITPTDTRPVQAVRRSRGVPTGAAALGVVALIGLAAALFWPRAETPLTFGQTVQVTLEPGLEMYPSLSPDGRTVAYVAGPFGSQRVFVKSVTGGTAVQVTREPQGDHVLPRWSPDGSQIVFHANASIYVVPALGGTPRLVASNTDTARRAYATWSPAGDEIAYVEGTLAVRQMARLYRRRLDGGEPRLITQDIEIHSPTWSPDGKWIAYVSGNLQYAYGGALLGNLGPSALFVVATEGGAPIQLTDRRHLYTSPTWMPDGRSLLVVSSRDGGRDVYRVRLDRRGRAAGDPERLTTGLGAGTIALSPDGTQLGYTAFSNSANVWAVSIPASGSVSVRSAVPITSGSQHIEGLSVTPDGAWLAFDSDRSGNADIWKVSLAGGDPVQLTTDPRDDFIPAWSRDGRQVVFHSWRNGNRDVYVIGADGLGEQQVTSDSSHDFYSDWSPDGQRIAFHSNRTAPPQIWVVERSGAGWGEPRQVTTTGGTDARWSPDGRTIVYVGERGVGLLDLETGRETTLVGRLPTPVDSGGPVAAAWAPDGASVYVKARSVEGRASFWQVPVAGGAPRLLVRFDDPDRPSGRQEFATDGRRLFFTIDARESDVWVMAIQRKP
jgi:serine/threonine-protein kinase